MERLVDDIYTFKGKVEDVENDYIIEVQKKLKEYEDAEEQGLLLRLPVAFDKTIYVIEHGEIVEDTLFAVNQDVVGLWAIDTHGSLVGTFGTNVFASREEAEAALAEKGGAE